MKPGKDDRACLPSTPLTGPALKVVPAIAWDPAFPTPTCNSGILELQGKVQDPDLLEEPETWPQKLFTKVGSANIASAPPLSVCWSAIMPTRNCLGRVPKSICCVTVALPADKVRLSTIQAERLLSTDAVIKSAWYSDLSTYPKLSVP